MDLESLEKLRRLPVDQEQVWQGAVVQLPASAPDELGIVRPIRAGIWVSFHPIVLGQPLIQSVDHDPMELLLEALYEFSFGEMGGESLPGRIEVSSPDQAKELNQWLGESIPEIVVVDPLEPLNEVLDELKLSLEENEPPDRWAVSGVEPSRIEQLMDSGVKFLAARPWLEMTEYDLIEVVRPKPPSGMRYVVVLGAAGTFRGLGCYGDPEVHFAVFRGEVDLMSESFWQVAFDRPDELSENDLALAQRMGLTLSEEGEYPVVQQYTHYELRPAKDARIKFAAGLLAALAATSSEQFDSGHWKVPVKLPGSGRATTFELKLPDVLDPPTYEEWMSRGAPADRSAHEKILQSIQQAVEEQGIESGKDLEELLSRNAFSQAAPQFPDTPQGRALNIAEQASQSFGRRRALLAKQALELDSDCVEALLILADLTGEPESQYEWYQRAYETAESRLDPSLLESVGGQLWMVLEARNYLRALFGLAIVAAELDHSLEAIQHLEKLLELDESDHLGGRYVLLSLLLAEGRDHDAARLVKRYQEETTQWAYAQAILAFRLSGDSPASRKVLARAFRLNPHIAEVMISEDPPAAVMQFSPGSPEEAVIFIDEFSEALMKTPDVIDWIVEHFQSWRSGELVTEAEDE